MPPRYLLTGRTLFVSLALVFTCAILSACSGSPSRAQTDTKAPETAVQTDPDVLSVDRFIDTFQECYTSKDIEGLSALLTDDGNIIVDFSGKIRSYSSREWLELTRNIFENTSQLSDRLTERVINVYGNIAVVQCRYDFESPVERSTGHDIFSLVRDGDSWLIVSLMYSGKSKL